jgi:4'-phosphopantetheinyl transferase EntD
MIDDILPDKVRSAEAFDDPAGVDLFPEEEAAISRAVGKRRREFTTARYCARKALAELGHPPIPLIPGERGAPTWPEQIVGSMTHCAGYRAAALAHAADVVTIGIDAEPDEPLPDGVLDTIARAEEQGRLRELADVAQGAHWDRLLFSAKESVYKAWFPLTRAWLGFEDASIDIDPVGATFSARLMVEGPEVNGRQLSTFHGRWVAVDGLVVTAIAVLAEQDPLS